MTCNEFFWNHSTSYFYGKRVSTVTTQHNFYKVLISSGNRYLLSISVKIRKKENIVQNKLKTSRFIFIHPYTTNREVIMTLPDTDNRQLNHIPSPIYHIPECFTFKSYFYVKFLKVSDLFVNPFYFLIYFLACRHEKSLFYSCWNSLAFGPRRLYELPWSFVVPSLFFPFMTCCCYFYYMLFRPFYNK